MDKLLQCMEWMDESITAIYGMNGLIDDCNIWNEWINWWLQYMEWMNELMTAIYGMNGRIDCCNIWN